MFNFFVLCIVACTVQNSASYMQAMLTGNNVASTSATTSSGSSITNEMMFDPAACPPDFVLMAVRKEAEQFVLYGVKTGSPIVRFDLSGSTVIPLGETDPAVIGVNQGDNTLLITEYDFAGLWTCIGQFFMPGNQLEWTDGATLLDVETFDIDMQGFGFRVPDATTALLATAGPENSRLLYGNERDIERCEPDDMNPGNLIGSYPDCVSSFGLADQMSYWANMDCVSMGSWQSYSSYASGLTCDGAGAYVVVAGPNARTDTFYYPGTFGVHTHPADDAYRYADDRIAYLEAQPFGWEEGWPGFQAFFEEFTSFSDWYRNDPQ